MSLPSCVSAHYEHNVLKCDTTNNFNKPSRKPAAHLGVTRKRSTCSKKLSLHLFIAVRLLRFALYLVTGLLAAGADKKVLDNKMAALCHIMMTGEG